MRPLDRALAAMTLSLACAGVCAEPPGYGQVDTFQPGKKYNCVPTADRKGWNCKEAGKATIPAPESAPTPATAAPTPDAAPTPEAAPVPEAAPTPAMAAPTPANAIATPAAAAPHASALPAYLTNSAANGMRPMPAAPAPKPAPRPRVKGPMIPAQAPAATPSQAPTEMAPAPTPASAAAPSAPDTAPVAAPAAPESTPAAGDSAAPTAIPAAESAAAPPPTPAAASPASSDIGSAQEFLDLPADAYVIALAHAETEAALVAPRLAHAKVYKLNLRQNDVAVWLLVCGPYDDLDAARAARDEMAAQGVTPGWPRRVGPLQTEVKRAPR